MKRQEKNLKASIMLNAMELDYFGYATKVEVKPYGKIKVEDFDYGIAYYTRKKLANIYDTISEEERQDINELFVERLTEGDKIIF